jgi:hypothetical protein
MWSQTSLVKAVHKQQVTLLLETLVGLAQSDSCQAQCSQRMGKRLATEPGHSPVLRNTASSLPLHLSCLNTENRSTEDYRWINLPNNGLASGANSNAETQEIWRKKKTDHLTHPKLCIYKVTNTINSKKRKSETKNVFNFIFYISVVLDWCTLWIYNCSYNMSNLSYLNSHPPSLCFSTSPPHILGIDW